MKKLALLICLSLTFFACTKDEVTSEEVVLENVLFKTFVYQNSEYTIQVNENGDPVDANIDDRILEAIVTSNIVEIDDQNISYLFDDLDKMNEFISERVAAFEIKSDNSKMSGNAGSTGYQHETFQGFPLGGTNNFRFPSLRPHGFDNLISSCLIFNNSSRPYLAQYFEHENYQGRVFSVILSPGGLRVVTDMRSVGLHDRVSSMLGQFL